MIIVLNREEFDIKKVFKATVIALLILSALQAVIFITARHGWRFFGFDMCESPDVLQIDTVYVTDEIVHIVGTTSSSATSYVGYTYELKDNVLYVGIKQNLLFGFIDRIGAYSFTIKGDFDNIESVCLVNKKDEKRIWSVQNDKKYMEKIKSVRLYKTVHVSSEYDYKEKVRTEEFVYAEDELLNRMRHPMFSDDRLRFTKGTAYLGVAESDSGEEMYLIIDDMYDLYSIIGSYGYYCFQQE